jgi:hypothetical protein
MNPVDALTSQYKKGWKTSELWVALAVGLSQVLGATFDPGAPVNDQLSNLTWVAISYILGRSGLKVARVNAQGKVVSTTAETQAMAGSMMPATFPDELAFDEPLVDDFAFQDALEEHSA